VNVTHALLERVRSDRTGAARKTLAAFTRERSRALNYLLRTAVATPLPDEASVQ